MKKTFSRSILMLLAALLLFALAIPALAEEGGRSYVVDECGVLGEDVLNSLNERAARISSENGCNVIFVITDKAGDAGITGYIAEKYQAAFGEATGVAYGHDTKLGKIGVAHFGEADGKFAQADDERLLDAYNNSNTYEGGITALLDGAERILIEGSGAVIDATEAPTAEPAPTAVPAGEPGVRIQDLAGLLSESQKAALREKLDTISKKHDCDVVVIAARSLGNKEARLYAADFYEATGFAQDGIVMLVCPEERDYAFCATGDGKTAMTEDAYSKLDNVVVDELRYDNYYEAFNKFADCADEFLTAAENGKPYKQKLISTGAAGVLAGIVGLITGGIGTGSMKSKLRSVEKKQSASEYMKQGSLNIMNANEIFLYSTVSRTPIQTEPRGSSGSSGSFHSSSGGSWSGHSGKY